MPRRYADDHDFEATWEARQEARAPSENATADRYERRTDSAYWHHDRHPKDSE